MHAETTEYRGVTYRRYPDSKSTSLRRYFYGKRNGANEALHRRVWEDAHGPIPLGYVVHHKDGVTGNNSLGNLECLTTAEHGAEHRYSEHPLAAYKRGWAKNNRTPARKAPTKYTCAACGGMFTSFQTDRAKFCSNKCHDDYHRAAKGGRVGPSPATCVVCGTGFETNRGETACSDACRIERERRRETERHQKRYTPRTPRTYTCVCDECGAGFEGRRPTDVNCSDQCRKSRTLRLQRERRTGIVEPRAGIQPDR